MPTQKTDNLDSATCETARTSKSTSIKISESGPEHNFKIFCDEQQLTTPQRSIPLSNADYVDRNDENSHSAPIFKFISKSTPKITCLSSAKRTPLAEVTRKTGTRPRSTSGFLARIASLEEELKQSKEKVSELRGEIVAYQDALYQADVDAGYL